MTDEMRPDDEKRSRLSRLRSIDADFAHTVVESGVIEAQTGGWSGGTTRVFAFQPITRTTSTVL